MPVAKKAAKAKKEPGTGPTGLLIACPNLGFPYPSGAGRLHKAMAIVVLKGPKRYWAQCPVCYTRVTFGRYAWSDHFGMTPAQAAALGMESPL